MRDHFRTMAGLRVGLTAIALTQLSFGATLVQAAQTHYGDSQTNTRSNM